MCKGGLLRLPLLELGWDHFRGAFAEFAKLAFDLLDLAGLEQSAARCFFDIHFWWRG